MTFACQLSLGMKAGPITTFDIAVPRIRSSTPLITTRTNAQDEMSEELNALDADRYFE
jgi:hypothetical protein